MPVRGKKSLHLGKSLEDLNKMADYKLVKGWNIKNYCQSASKVFNAADSEFKSGDEEKAYVFFMKYFNIVKQIHNTNQYKADKKFFDQLLGKNNVIKAIEKAEELSKQLERRYADLQEEEELKRRLDEEEEKEKLEIERGESGEDTMETENKDEESVTISGEITPPQLYRLLEDGSTSVLVMDVRPEEQYLASHIMLRNLNCINVSQAIVKAGITVKEIEKGLNGEYMDLWKSRGSVDFIVLLDWESSLTDLMVGSPLKTLKDAIFKFDATVVVKSEPLVLQGGYDSWLLHYPQFTTNPKIPKPPKYHEIASISKLLDFDYPTFDEDKPEPPKPVENNKQDGIMMNGDVIHAAQTSPTAESANRPAMPVVDRSRKPKSQPTSPVEGSVTVVANSLAAVKPDGGTAAGILPQQEVRVANSTPKVNSTASVPSVDRSKKPKEGLSPTAETKGMSPEMERTAQGITGTDRTGKEKTRELEKATQEQERIKKNQENELKAKIERERLEKIKQEQRKKAAEEKAFRERKEREEAARKKEEQIKREKDEQIRKDAEEARRKNASEEERKKMEKKAEMERRRQEEEQRLKEKEARERKEQQEKMEREAREKEEAEKERRIQEEVELKTAQERERFKKEQEAKELLRQQKEEAARKQIEQETAEKLRLEREEKLKAQQEAEKLRRQLQEQEDKAAKLQKAKEAETKAKSQLPVGWEKAWDDARKCYFYIDHNTATTHWQPPDTTTQGQPAHRTPQVSDAKNKGSYKMPLQTEPKSNLKRSHSSPNIAQMVHQDEMNIPSFDRKTKPSAKMEPSPTPQRDLKPSDVSSAKVRNLNPVYGSQGRALTGLRNLGNTCFMNSVIQSLAGTTPLATYFIGGNYRYDINRENKLGRGGEVAEEFAVLINAMWSGQYKSIAPRDFKSTVSKFVPQFAGYEQQDSQEFLLFLLDGLHEDLNRVKQRKYIEEKDNSHLPDVEAARLSWESHKRLNQSIMVELFQGQFKSTIQCLKCMKTSVTFDAFMYLSLPLPSNSRCTLYDCLKNFSKLEKVTGSDKWYCPRCKVHREANKKIEIWKLPYILLIHLKRFSYEGVWRHKLQTYVDFPLTDFNMRGHVIGPNTKSAYNLYAVSNHYGTIDGGHYTAYCKHSLTQRWYKFDDTEVYEMSSSGVRSSAAYILFYSSIEVQPPTVSGF
ncbi:LOW QUALITY PROTEIN: ubiquitin carboxyl-terminal hydrolase 8-like [Ptychodera flava]|uniref:LOW QUALITY PROTEIN: ubiquitin carboxyl-terminal hydrolase 8-like n=1 Tax=Ptychodera flava TaxID=63121 RepID=UPI00396A4E4D